MWTKYLSQIWHLMPAEAGDHSFLATLCPNGFPSLLWLSTGTNTNLRLHPCLGGKQSTTKLSMDRGNISGAGTKTPPCKVLHKDHCSKEMEARSKPHRCLAFDSPWIANPQRQEHGTEMQ